MTKNFVIYNGYVESQSATCLMVNHKTGFETAEEAMDDIYAVLESFAKQYLCHVVKDCCRKNFQKNPTAKFCMTCGQAANDDFDLESSISNFWETLWTGCSESIPYEFYQLFDNAGWMWGFSSNVTNFMTVFNVNRYFCRYDGEPEDELYTA